MINTNNIKINVQSNDAHADTLIKFYFDKERGKFKIKTFNNPLKLKNLKVIVLVSSIIV